MKRTLRIQNQKVNSGPKKGKDLFNGNQDHKITVDRHSQEELTFSVHDKVFENIFEVQLKIIICLTNHLT